ncbi:MAG: hypothetical protein ACK5W9_09270 [Bdellovibrionales bacterium]
MYQNVLNVCRQTEVGLEIGMRFRASMLVSYDQFGAVIFNFDGSKLTEITSKNRGLSPEMSTWLNSGGFYKALQECFPNSESRRDAFVLSLIVADTIGRGVGTIQGVLSIILSIRLSKWIVNNGYKILQETRIGSRLKPDKEKIHKLVAESAILFMLLAKPVYEVVKDSVEKYNLSQSERRDVEEIIFSAEKEIQSLEKKKVTLSPEKKCEVLSYQKIAATLISDLIKRLQLSNSNEIHRDDIQRAALLSSDYQKLSCN